MARGNNLDETIPLFKFWDFSSFFKFFTYCKMFLIVSQGLIVKSDMASTIVRDLFKL